MARPPLLLLVLLIAIALTVASVQAQDAVLLLPGALALAAIDDDQTPAPQPSRRVPLRLVPSSTFNADVFADLEDLVRMELNGIPAVDPAKRGPGGGATQDVRRGLDAGDQDRFVYAYVEARASYERVIAAKPDADTTGRAYLGLALTGGAVKDFNLALPSLQQAVRLLPASANLQLAGGLIQVQKRDLKSAIPLLRAAVQLNPQDYTSQYWLGFTLLHGDGASDEASLAAFREALRLRVGDSNARTGIGMASIKLGYVDDAIAAFEPLIARKFTNRIAYWFLGLAYLNVNRRADAVALAQKLQMADKKLGDELARVIADWK